MIWALIALLICGWGAVGIAAVQAGQWFDETRETKSTEVLW